MYAERNGHGRMYDIGKTLFVAGATNDVIPLPYTGENVESLPRKAA